MHVRIAWEIYKNKRKSAGGGLEPGRGPPLMLGSAAQPPRGTAAGPLDSLGASQPPAPRQSLGETPLVCRGLSQLQGGVQRYAGWVGAVKSEFS